MYNTISSIGLVGMTQARRFFGPSAHCPAQRLGPKSRSGPPRSGPRRSLLCLAVSCLSHSSLALSTCLACLAFSWLAFSCWLAFSTARLIFS